MTRPNKRQKLRHEDTVSAYGTWMSSAIKKGLTEMYYKAFTSGDWMGQDWSDGKRQSSVVGYSTARSYGDQKSKEHDIEIAKGKRKREDIDQDFIDGMWGHGIHNSIAALAVGADRTRRMGKFRGGSHRSGQDFNTPANMGTWGKERPKMTDVKITQSKKGQPSSSVAKELFPIIGENPDDPTPAPTLAKKAAAAMMNTGDEVPVARVPRNISKIHPNHYTIRLPYIAKLEVQGTSIGYTNSRPIALIRLNSIYDPIMEHHGGITYSTTTGVPSTSEVNQAGFHDIDKAPQGRDIWAAHFKYYRVLRSDVKLTFLNKFCSQVGTAVPIKPLSDTAVYTNAFAVGYELIDEDSLTCNNGNMFMMTRNAVRDILGPAEVAHVFGTGTLETDYIPRRPNVHVMTKTYIPEEWQWHVEQHTQDQRWTAVGANPAVDHLLAVRAFHMSETLPLPRPSANYWFGVMIQIEYEVQFMECLDNFLKVENQANVSYNDSTGRPDGVAFTP